MTVRAGAAAPRCCARISVAGSSRRQAATGGPHGAAVSDVTASPWRSCPVRAPRMRSVRHLENAHSH